MRIKIATLSLALTDLALFMALFFVMASKPAKGATRSEEINFVIRTYGLLALLSICLLVTLVFVWIWIQDLREEHSEQTRKNLQELIEGTLQDHGRKPS